MSDGHEFKLIERIRQQVTDRGGVPVGIGDDAAVLAVGDGESQLLVAKDVLMEGVHFDLSAASPQEAGRKALAVNLSDVAAMAGRPTAAFVGLVLPRNRGAAFGDAVMDGVLTLAAEYDVTIAGGDTNVWDGPCVISVTVTGVPTGKGPVLRSGAKAGDWLMVTGRLGGSLESGRHLRFTPRLREAELLNTTVDVKAMIDLSDGFASDVQHVLTASNFGAHVVANSLPIHPDVDTSLSDEARRQRALCDGEDFELLFAVTPAVGQRLLERPLFDIPVTQVGCIVDEAGCWLESESQPHTRLEPTGWQHRFGE